MNGVAFIQDALADGRYTDSMNEIKSTNKPADDISVCGTNCAACTFLGTLCGGCNASGGKVFHSGGGFCPIYDCVKNQRELPNCGQCKKLPCEIWRKTRDPSFSDEEFENNIAERIKTLLSLREKK